MSMERKLERLLHKKEQLTSELHELSEQISYLEEEIRLSKSPYQEGPGVYVIKCHNRYKIGKADDLRYRLSGLQTGCPYELHVVNFIPCGENENGRLEKALHKRFETKRLRGEWYRLDANDLKDIETIKSERKNGHLLDAFISRGPFSAIKVIANDKQIDKFVVDIIRAECKIQGGSALVSVVLDQCENAGLSRHAAENVIARMRRDGDVFEPRVGMIKLP